MCLGRPTYSSMRNPRPMGFAPFKSFRANDSLTIATFGDAAVSRSSKSRPATNGVPRVLKYPGLTRLKFGVTLLFSVPSMRTLLFQRSEEHTSELQSRLHLVCRLLLEKKKVRNTG